MAANLKELVRDNLSTTAADLIVSGSTESIFIGQLVFKNNSTTESREVTVWILPDGVSDTTDNILAIRTIPAGKSWICQEALGQALTGGSLLKSKQDAGTDVHVVGSGVVEV
ncbi:MAG: hypothetical protein EP297_00130 [Gammaproteobacteria bacterium]|nr:MAG: hypothetical protein EP297_00130 [Gammaproteobacteria bacterium]